MIMNTNMTLNESINECKLRLDQKISFLNYMYSLIEKINHYEKINHSIINFINSQDVCLGIITTNDFDFNDFLNVFDLKCLRKEPPRFTSGVTYFISDLTEQFKFFITIFKGE